MPPEHAGFPPEAPQDLPLPHEVRVTGLRFWTALLGLGLGGAALWVLAVVAAADIFAWRAPLWLVATLVGLAALAWLPLYGLLRPTYTLYSDRIVRHRFWGDRTLYRADIWGVEVVEDDEGGTRRTLAPRRGRGRRIGIEGSLRADPIARRWLEGLRDPDAEARAAAEAALLADPRYGATPEARRRRLRQAWAVSWVAAVAGLAIFLWAVIKPEPYRWVIGAAALAPWVGGAIVVGYRGLVTWGEERDDPRPSIMPLVVCGLALPLRAIADIDTIDWAPLLMAASVAGLGAGLVLTLVGPTRPGRPEHRSGAQVLIAALVVSPWLAAYAYGLGAEWNYLLDDDRGQVFRTVVTDHSESHGDGSSYELSVSDWGDHPGRSFRVTEAFYRRTSVGDGVCVYLYPGALHLRYVEVGRCREDKARH